MRTPLAVLLLAVAVPALAQVDPSADLTDLWNRLRGRATPVAGAGMARVVSWNVQTLGKKASKKKKDALRADLAQAFAGAGPSILAAQEVANDAGAETLARQLPDGGRGWRMSFRDTPDAMNNAVYVGPGVVVDCSGNLMIEGVRHPPHMAHLTVGQADFTLLSVHLSYDKGDASASLDELRKIMEWVKVQAAKPGADPDFVIAGDFNLATGKGKARSKRAGDSRFEPIEDGLPRGFSALVDEPTSRHGRSGASNNYDHFIVSDDFKNEELVVAGAVSTAEIDAAEGGAGARASDHYPIALTFRSSGAGADGRPIALDGASTCR